MNEVEYLLSERQALYLTMVSASDPEAKNAGDICFDMVKVLVAWNKGRLLPRWEVPHLNGLFQDFKTPDA
jgi:hypothetical protein